MRESVIERALCDRIKALGGEVRKVRFLDRNGAPDRLVLLPMRNPKLVAAFEHFNLPVDAIRPTQTVWVELKAPGKKPKAHQLREHQCLRDMGQVVLVIDTLEQIDTCFPLTN